MYSVTGDISTQFKVLIDGDLGRHERSFPAYEVKNLLIFLGLCFLFEIHYSLLPGEENTQNSVDMLICIYFSSTVLRFAFQLCFENYSFYTMPRRS